MACSAFASYGHSSSYVHIDHLSHGLGAYDDGYGHYDDHDYHVSYNSISNFWNILSLFLLWLRIIFHIKKHFWSHSEDEFDEYK